MPTAKNGGQMSGDETKADQVPASRRRRTLKFSAMVIPFLLVGLFVGLTLDIGSRSIFAARQVWVALIAAVLTLVVVVAIMYIVYRITLALLGQSARDASHVLFNWLMTDRTAESWNTQVKPHLPKLLPLFGTYLAFVGPAALVLALMTQLLLIAQFEVGRLQAERLGEQNILLDLQQQFVAIDRQAQSDMQDAQRRYDEIVRILSDSNSIAEQVFALEQIPDAMIMSVQMPRRAEDEDGNQTVIEETMYPNLEVLRSRLVAFMKADRLLSEDAEIGRQPVSNAIIRTLHRLGYGGGNSEGDSLWKLASADTSNQKNPEQLKNMLRDISGVMNRKLPPDLRHVTETGEFSGIDIQGAYLRGVNLQGSDLKSVNLQWAMLNFAKLQGANLNSANLQGALLISAKFQGASLQRANLKGAVLTYASFLGADLSSANLQGAYLDEANLRGAILSEAILLGADLREAYLLGASLVNVNLQGADLRNARLQGTQFSNLFSFMSNARLQGVDFRDAKLQGAKLKNTNLESLDNVRLVRRKSKSGRFWYERVTQSSAENDEISQFTFPAALLTDCSFGEITLWRVKSSASLLHSALFDSVWQFDDYQVQRLRWESLEDAKDDLSQVISDDISEYIVEFHYEFTNFEDAKLNGVFIDEETRSSLDPNATTPPPAVIFANAVTDENAIAERKDWKFPGEPLPESQESENDRSTPDEKAKADTSPGDLP